MLRYCACILQVLDLTAGKSIEMRTEVLRKWL